MYLFQKRESQGGYQERRYCVGIASRPFVRFIFRRLKPHLLLRDCNLKLEIPTEFGFRGQNLLSMSPLSIASMMLWGGFPSTWHPTLYAVPRISLTVPLSSLAKDLKRIVRAISIISSRLTDLLCLMFFSFFRSRGGSFRALMMRDEAVGTTETAACRFWIVSLTVTRKPFCN